MKKIMIYLSGLSLFFTMVSCQNWLTIQPEDEIEKTKLFQSEEGFWQALNGAYYLTKQGHQPDITDGGDMQVKAIEYLAGIWDAGSQTSEYKLTTHEYKDGGAENILGNIFLYQYNLIAHANTILEYLNKVDFIPEKSHSLLKGESMAFRAWAHFDLIRLWGPMPKNIDTKARYLPYVKQTSKKVNIYDTYDSFMLSLVNDLDSAEVLLAKYEPLIDKSCNELNSNVDLTGNERLEFRWRQNRFNYYAVLALRARVALWMNDKETAYKYASMVKNAKNADGTPKFRLGTASDITNVADVDLNDNTLKCEHLFAYVEDEGHYNPDAIYGPKGQLTTSTANIEELYQNNNTDIRYKLCWRGTDKTTTYKYNLRTSVWIPMIRLSETYLILVEVAPLDEANQIYKEFCESRGATYNPINEEVRKNITLTEYYKEFFAEGQIFFANKRMGSPKLMWNDGKMSEAQYVLPIPRRETEIFN